MKHKTLYILLVEKKPIVRKRFFKKLRDNDEARFQLWQWVIQNHNIQRHFECYMSTDHERHVEYMKRYASHYFLEFTLTPTPEIASTVKILFETYQMVEYYNIEKVFYAWLSHTLHKVVADQYNHNIAYQCNEPIEYISETFTGYPMLSESLFQAKGRKNLVRDYGLTIAKLARSIYYLVGEVLGYHIRYPKSLQIASYSN